MIDEMFDDNVSSRTLFLNNSNDFLKTDKIEDNKCVAQHEGIWTGTFLWSPTLKTLKKRQQNKFSLKN